MRNQRGSCIDTGDIAAKRNLDLALGHAPMCVNLAALNRITEVVPQFAYRYSDEQQLQQAIAIVLESAGVSFEREVSCGPRDRFDFLCEGNIVIEAKIHGSYAAAIRQIDRDLALPTVGAAVLVTARFWASSTGTGVASLRGKPVRVVKIGAQAF
jgi:hypothetical protein